MTTLAKGGAPHDEVICGVILRALKEAVVDARDADQSKRAAGQVLRLATDYPVAWDRALERAASEDWRAKADELIRATNAAVRRQTRGIA